MRPTVFGASAVAFLSIGLLCDCTAAPTPASRSATPGGPGVQASDVLEIVGPTAIGFFPAYEESRVATDPGLASGLEHFEFAMADLSRCVEPAGVKVQVVVAGSLRVRDGEQMEELPLEEVVPENAGCYLVAPGRPPRIVRGRAGTSSLVQLCPAAASVYFDIASCCPAGFRCCPDGEVIDETTSCDG